MSSSMISVENLGKKFVINHQQPERYTTLRDTIVSSAKKIISFPKHLRAEKPKNMSEDFWALKNVDFDINPGDRVGIIGRNGAGKSTLLKVLSRITEPSTGSAQINGRVASLLEVGTGFHPELTGRENIFLNGAILGMSRTEIRKKFDEIVDFAEVENFLDTPVKRYSSGMYVRLAFAVAAHLEPEILIVDEVLAVGDAQFQKKCLGKMEDVSKNASRTVLFVSHQMTAMQSLCNKGILLERGQVVYTGHITNTITNYLNQYIKSNRAVEYPESAAPGNYLAKFLKARVYHPDADKDVFEIGDPVMLEFSFLNLKAGQTVLDITFHLIDEMGHLVFVGSTAYYYEEMRTFGKGVVHVTCKIPENILHEGSYNIHRLLLVQDRGIVNFEMRDIIQFEVIAEQKEQFGWAANKEGVVRPYLEWAFVG
jgi:lipopolysaccharide transport system ATP-binding protein